MAEENQAILKACREIAMGLHGGTPLHVLEIGTGPGRVIALLLNSDLRYTIKKIVGIEQNKDIHNEVQKRFEDERVRVFIRNAFVGIDESGHLHSIRHALKKSLDFHIVLAVSNLVGWQCSLSGSNWKCKEREFLIDILKHAVLPGGGLFFTVYKKDELIDLERARMYRAAGDIIEFVDIGGQRHIAICTDAFSGEKHVSKAYTISELEKILNDVRSNLQRENIDIEYTIDSSSMFYMYGVIIRRLS
ncbi:class I SAM-dependent methyltransferase [Thermococcus sp. LS1]|uniref:class I SAM-dependent methyltransferase n=1 Tax=Thermococcus sp. LS1 TaxID=1638259 RepID=UPI00143A24EB|nr:class I SAM-dependent methyltransferase [Thermococcus sp. LS1]